MRKSRDVGWPESYGFRIAGGGPCYVISVDRGSPAQQSGIAPGDQLLELDGRSVQDMSADAIKTLARHSRTQPPTVGVASRVTHVSLVANHRWGYGFQATGVQPTVVEAIDPPGPAYEVGLKVGDYILEVNGHEIKSLTLLHNLLATRHGKMSLTVIPRDIINSSASESAGNVTAFHLRSSGRQRRAGDLFARMNLLLGSDYEKKMTVLRLLRQYADNRSVHKFATSLNLVLHTVNDRKLLADLRPFIPLKHRPQFDDITGFTPPSGRLGTLSVNTSGYHSNYPSNATLPPSEGLLSIAKQTYRRARVKRGDSGSYGFVLRGSAPVCVESVMPGGPAHTAGIKHGDAILSVNHVDVSKCSHGHLVEILQAAGDAPLLEVQQQQKAGVSTTGAHTAPIHGHRNGQSTSNNTDTLTSQTSEQTSSSWLSSSHVSLDGRGFREKVHELLNAREKQHLRKALIEFNTNRNASVLIEACQVVMDTPAKRTLWAFLMPRLNPAQQQQVRVRVQLPPDVIETLGDPDVTDASRVSGTTIPAMKRTFRQQLEYLLTAAERKKLKSALEVYAEKRNLHFLMGGLWDLLDTPSKQVLWGHVLPMLSTSHQKIARAILGLPDDGFSAEKSLSSFQRQERKEGKDTGDTKGKGKTRRNCGRVLPKYGDILLLQSKFGDMHLHRKEHHFQDTSSDELAPRYGSVSPVSGAPSMDSSLDGDKLNHKQFELRRRPGFPAPSQQWKGPISDVEHSTMTINPIYETESADYGARPKTKLLREEVTQTTPAASPANRTGHSVSFNLPDGYSRGIPGLPLPRGSPRNSPTMPRSHSTPGASGTSQFRTIVNVSQAPSGSAEIVYSERSGGFANNTGYDARQQEPERLHILDTIPESGYSMENLRSTDSDNVEPVRSSVSCSSIDDSSVQQNKPGSSDPFYHTLDSPKRGRGGLNKGTSPKKTPPWKRKFSPAGLSRSVAGSEAGTGNNSPVVTRHKFTIPDMPLATVSVSQLKARLYENYAETQGTKSGQKGRDGGVKELVLTGGSRCSPGQSIPTSPRSPRSPTSNASDEKTSAGGTNETTYGGDAGKDQDPGSKHSQQETGATESVKSLSDSYQTNVTNAIKSLDEAVANERSGSSDHDHMMPRPSHIPQAPPLPPPGTPPTSMRMNVKRMNWEKISAPASKSVWAKIERNSDELTDIVKYLELEQQFSTKKNKVSESFRDRKAEKCILNHKKAYNISILLGHLKLPVAEVEKALLAVDEKLLSIELLKQILAYAPDASELEKYSEYQGRAEELSKPDQFMYELSRVPGYEMRLQAILFKANFDEKVDEIKQNLAQLKKAARELQRSDKLARVLELVLAMGNYMNKGSVRVGRAAGFRVAFLQQLELTKTHDGKASFLHVLADAIKAKCPELLDFGAEITTVAKATIVSREAMEQEIAELKRVVEEISGMVRSVGGLEARVGVHDRFHHVMQMFISTASDKIKSLNHTHEETMREIQEMAVYFGENRNYKNPEEIFKIFAEFTAKFEKAHKQNLITKRPDRSCTHHNSNTSSTTHNNDSTTYSSFRTRARNYAKND